MDGFSVKGKAPIFKIVGNGSTPFLASFLGQIFSLFHYSFLVITRFVSISITDWVEWPLIRLFLFNKKVMGGFLWLWFSFCE